MGDLHIFVQIASWCMEGIIEDHRETMEWLVFIVTRSVTWLKTVGTEEKPQPSEISQVNVEEMRD